MDVEVFFFDDRSCGGEKIMLWFDIEVFSE